jgi:hypothetical protein
MWFVRQPVVAPSTSKIVRDRRLNERLVFLFVCALALATGVLRGFVGVRSAIGNHRIAIFVGEAVVTTISVFWLELVTYGFLRERACSQTQKQ